jgi:hypothetical protein
MDRVSNIEKYSQEYKRLFSICKRWVEKRHISKPKNPNEGEMVALQFRCYIEEKYPVIYREIIYDSNCYYEILMDIFKNRL